MCSTILAAPDETFTKNVNETMINSTNINGTAASFSGESGKGMPSTKYTTDKLLEKLDMTSLRKAGLFLKEPDCRVFLCGFNDHHQMHLRRSLKSAGAVPVNELTSSVTHVIVNQTIPTEHIKIIDMLQLSPYFVSLEWLIESMHMGRAVSESDFFVSFLQSKQKESSFMSNIPLGDTIGPLPNSRKESVKLNSKQTPQESNPISEDQMEDDIIAQYGGINERPSVIVPSDENSDNHDHESTNDTTISFKMPEKEIKETDQSATLSKIDEQKHHRTNMKELNPKDANEQKFEEKTLTDDSTSKHGRFFLGKTFCFLGFDEENVSEFSECVKEVGGTVMNNNLETELDFLIVPPTLDSMLYQTIHAKQVVSNFWLEDCLEQGLQLDVQYYHSSINVSDQNKPCRGVVIGITGYCGKEREFIHTLAEALGMISQEIFAKRDKKGALRSTHLICAFPEGAKYEAGIKWALPVVTKDWLLACLQYKDWVSEKSFLIGNATKYTEGKPDLASNHQHNDKENVKNISNTQSPNRHIGKTKEGFAEYDAPENSIDYKTPKSTRAAAVKDLETPFLPIFEKNRKSSRPVNFALTPDVDSFSKLPPESQPSPSNLKRKREEDAKVTPYILRNVKTPETPYGAFLEKNPSRETRKFWKLQCDELGRFEYTSEQRAELEAKKKRLEQYAKECEEEREKNKMDKEYEEYFKHALDPERTKEMHIKTFKKYGVPILEKGSKTFEELMEEKMQKQGISWKNPKRFKLQTKNADCLVDNDQKLECKESKNSKDNSKDTSIAAEQLSVQLAKFNELAQMNDSLSKSNNCSMPKSEEKDSFASENKSKRRSSMKMTLSSIEVETDRRLDIETSVEAHYKKESKQPEINSESQIRWVNPKEEEERKKLAARLALESQELSEENQSRSEGKNYLQVIIES